jgi:PBP1b-binding outer membrane lipoprotein LpoB
MKKIIVIFVVILLLNSCVSYNKFIFGPTITANELKTIEIIGSVETIFETTIDWNKKNTLLERSHYELLKEAKKNYSGDIDIKNIILEKRSSNKNLFLFIPLFFNTYVNMSYTNVYARGEVIKYNNVGRDK